MRLLFCILTLTLPFAARADVPRVVTDIAPIHSLVAQVMGDLGTADVLVSGAASPHDFQFGFAQASAVQNADLVIWAGPLLTPWLEGSLAELAPDAVQLILLDTDGWGTLERRDWDEDGDHDHDHDHGHDEDEDLDPHAWLNPLVATVWVDHIATQLIAADPQNEATYRDNADATIERLLQLDQEITARLANVPRAALLVPHDAYHYFGDRFDVPAVGAISLSDATSPSPAKIADLQAMMQDLGVVCVLSDPQARSEWSDLVREGTPARTAMADPMGGAFDAGPDHYRLTLLAMSQAYADCLGG